MIYFLHGTDAHKSRAKLHELLDMLAKKRPDSEVFKITSENWTDQQYEELLISQGLFSQKYIVVLDTVFEKKEIKEFVLGHLVEAQSAEHIFLILEGKVDVVTVKKIEKIVEKSQEFAATIIQVKDASFSNIFSIANYFAKRDKKNVWVSYIYFLRLGIAAEEIHGVIFWQVKNMILASRAKSQQETGLSPFVYKNALAGADNFSHEELLDLSSSLMLMTHKVRQGEGELPVMLEKAILQM